MNLKRIVTLFTLLLFGVMSAQDVELFRQFNGRYDYLAIGNTMNIVENQAGTPCDILTSSSADLFLTSDQELEAAYLYWAGSGTGDFDIRFNGIAVTPDRTFADSLDELRDFFAAVADVTDIIRTLGNTEYTVSNLDVTDIIGLHCPRGTNFAGWGLIVIYKDDSLPLNQVNLYEGLQSVPESISIELESLNVLDDVGAKIGFLAWEGDRNISITESLRINGDLISNPPLNPSDNAFNGTHSFTGSEELFNMDIDFYDIEDNIEPGDLTAIIELTSGQDFVMVNNIITVLNSQLPDATVQIDAIGDPQCGERTITVDFTVANTNSTDVLPAGTPIAFFANSTLVGIANTINELPIEGTESQTIVLTIPESVDNEFTLRASADNIGTNVGIVRETDETNNDFLQEVRLLKFPEIPPLENLIICEAKGIQPFDLTRVTQDIDPSNQIEYYLSEVDALAQSDAILNPEAFVNTENPQQIFVRVSNPDCFLIVSFTVEIEICPLPDATIQITENPKACPGQEFQVNYRVSNFTGTETLLAKTPIAFYFNELLVAQSVTNFDIPIGGSEEGSILIDLPGNLEDPYSLLLVVDDLGNSEGIIEELNEFNNTTKQLVSFEERPQLPDFPDLLACDIGFNTAVFDLTQQGELFDIEEVLELSYYLTPADAFGQINAITDPSAYENTINPQEIYVRLDNASCFNVGSFSIAVENCPPVVPQGFSPNADGINDVFEIIGLLDIFENHRLLIYNRHGALIFTGDNKTRHWEGYPNSGILVKDKLVPVGTYYYVLYLNDPEFNTMAGWLYLNR